MQAVEKVRRTNKAESQSYITGTKTEIREVSFDITNGCFGPFTHTVHGFIVPYMCTHCQGYGRQ